MALTAQDAAVMQEHFDAIEDAACAIEAWQEYRSQGRTGDPPETCDDIISARVPVSKHGDALWHRCMTLAHDIAMERGDTSDRSHIDAMKAKRIYKAIQERPDATNSEVAERFNVSVYVVSDIRTGRSWAHVTHHHGTPSNKKGVAEARQVNAKVTPEEVLEIYKAAHEGKETQAVIGDRYGVSADTVSAIKLGRYWADITGHTR